MRLVLAFAAAMLAASAAQAATPGYRVIERIAGPDGGWDFLRVDAAHNRLLVTRGTSVMAVDLASGKIEAGLAPGKRLHDALPVNDGAEMLVTNGGSNTAVFADARTGAPGVGVPTGENPDALVYDPKSRLVLVMNHTGGDVTLVDAAQHRAVGAIPVGEGGLEAAAADGEGRVFVNVEERNQIAVIDVAARKVVARYALPGCDGPTGLAYAPRHRWLIAACDGATAVVEARSGKPVRTLKTGKEADGVAYDAAQELAFVPGREGSLSLISLKGERPELVQVLKTDGGVRTLALDPRTGRVYLPAADFAAAKAGEKPAQQPGSFHVLVVGR